jgi:hypothetical protein
MGKCRGPKIRIHIQAKALPTTRPTDAEVVAAFEALAEDSGVLHLALGWYRSDKTWAASILHDIDPFRSIAGEGRTHAAACRKAIRAYRKAVAK